MYGQLYPSLSVQLGSEARMPGSRSKNRGMRGSCSWIVRAGVARTRRRCQKGTPDRCATTTVPIQRRQSELRPRSVLHERTGSPKVVSGVLLRSSDRSAGTAASVTKILPCGSIEICRAGAQRMVMRSRHSRSSTASGLTVSRHTRKVARRRWIPRYTHRGKHAAPIPGKPRTLPGQLPARAEAQGYPLGYYRSGRRPHAHPAGRFPCFSPSTTWTACRRRHT